jgi:hypothetical protein
MVASSDPAPAPYSSFRRDIVAGPFVLVLSSLIRQLR